MHPNAPKPSALPDEHTNLPAGWNDSLKGDFLWTNSNFGEAMPEVMTPFTWSLLQQGALAGWIQFRGQPTFGNLGGRLYFNVSVLASIFHLMGRDRQQALEAIEGVLHSSLPEDMPIPLIPAPRSYLLSILPGLVAMQIRQMQDIWGLPRLLAANPAWHRAMRQRLDQAQTAAELARLWSQELRPHMKKVWSGVLSSANYYSNYCTPLRQKLARLVGEDDADALISGLSSPSETLASLGLVLGLSRLARGQITRQAYLEQNGHRGPQEFEVSAPRLGEDPAWLERQLAEFEQAPVDVDAMLAQQRAASQAASQRLRERQPRQAAALLRQVAQIAPRGRLREASRSELGRVTWIVRAWALRAGALSGIGKDVFFLSIAETLALLGGDRSPLTHVPARRQVDARLRALPPYPPVIRGRFDPFQWAQTAAASGSSSGVYDASAPPLPAASDKPATLRGAPGSAGCVEGRVRRLDSPEQGDLLQAGEILVTALTNVAWTPLFPRCAAVVTDVGAPLSHAAVVARELGIPAVVGCGDATARLHTGDRLRVDGGAGLVAILELAGSGPPPAP
ncbi:MAG: PEP-utilizing enzyme [Chloroflexota bacterium]